VTSRKPLVCVNMWMERQQLTARHPTVCRVCASVPVGFHARNSTTLPCACVALHLTTRRVGQIVQPSSMRCLINNILSRYRGLVFFLDWTLGLFDI
jgi:hypothetical protein